MTSTQRLAAAAAPSRTTRTSRTRRTDHAGGGDEHERLYRAMTARDPRFDGVFFVGVTSTGIYCRPICPVKAPRSSHCRFFPSPQAAEEAGFRPCLRCRPELAPGLAPVDDAHRIAQLMVERLEQGQLGEQDGLEAVAAQFQLSSRQVRRIVQKELGVAPLRWLLTRRLLLAKQLLTETALPIREVALASGFSSLRRFHDAFRLHYRMPPTHLRRRAAIPAAAGAGPGSPAAGGPATRLTLCYRPPFDWAGLLSFLQARAIAGVEAVTGESYARTVRLGRAQGWFRVRPASRGHALEIEFSNGLIPVQIALLARVRNLFDLDARPHVIAGHLGGDPLLAASVQARPGLRVPGAFSGFEIAWRAILGQQVTVRAASTIAGRFAEAFGEPLAGEDFPPEGLSRFTPSPEAVARAGVDRIAGAGILAARARAIDALASARVRGGLDLDGASRRDPGAAISRMLELPGIGPWTAHYIALRVLRWPDAFPKEDIALRHALGNVTPAQAERLSQPWRPWRSYAVMHLWNRH